MVETKHLDAIADHVQFLINAMSQPVITSQEQALVGLKKSLTDAFNAIEGVEVKGSDNSNEEFKKSIDSLDKSVKTFKERFETTENQVGELESKIETFTNIVKNVNERLNALEKPEPAKPITIKVFKGKEEINGVELEYSAAKLPEKHFKSDSGFDGFVCFPDGFQTEEVLQPGETKKIPLGIQCQIPDGYEIQVRPRSGKTGDRINVGWGTVDGNFTGIIKANVSNDTTEPYTVKQGDKICQLVIGEVLPAVMEFAAEGEEIKATERGSNGFGSSGR